MRKIVQGAAFAAGMYIASLVSEGVAADLPRASWGEFITIEASESVTAGIDAGSGEGLKVILALEGLGANADGEKTDAAATFSGQFLVSQPRKSELGVFRATVSGLIIKTTGTSSRMDIALGPFKKTVEWTESEARSERFNIELSGVLDGGRVPSPFPVSAILMAKKAQDQGAVLLTVDKITLEASPALIGQNMDQPMPEWTSLPAQGLAASEDFRRAALGEQP